jgi:hypothetical protein
MFSKALPFAYLHASVVPASSPNVDGFTFSIMRG